MSELVSVPCRLVRSSVTCILKNTNTNTKYTCTQRCVVLLDSHCGGPRESACALSTLPRSHFQGAAATKRDQIHKCQLSVEPSFTMLPCESTVYAAVKVPGRIYTNCNRHAARTKRDTKSINSTARHPPPSGFLFFPLRHVHALRAARYVRKTAARVGAAHLRAPRGTAVVPKRREDRHGARRVGHEPLRLKVGGELARDLRERLLRAHASGRAPPRRAQRTPDPRAQPPDPPARRRTRRPVTRPP